MEDNDFEFVEFQNIGLQSINLLGTHFSNGIEFAFSDVTAPRTKSVWSFKTKRRFGFAMATTYVCWGNLPAVV